MFDTRFDLIRWGDADFGFRAVKNGYLLVYNPYSNYTEPQNKKGGLHEFVADDAFYLLPTDAPFPNPGVSLYYLKYLNSIKLFYYLGIVLIVKIRDTYLFKTPINLNIMVIPKKIAISLSIAKQKLKKSISGNCCL